MRTNRRLTKSRKEVHDFVMGLFPDIKAITKVELGITEWTVWFYALNEDGSKKIEKNSKGEPRPVMATESGVY